MVSTLPIQITCPKCGAKYSAQVLSIVDVGAEPRLKTLLLRGALNTVTCPSCGTPGRVSTPLLYHDPSKELLVLFVPPELNLPMAEREKLTGNMVSALMSAVPPEQRKGYFLNPRTALTMQGLIDDILKADGVTQEMMDEQRARSRLLQDLARAVDDPQQLDLLVEQNRQRIDYSFLMVLSSAAENSAMAGQEQSAQKLVQLRDAILARVPMVLPEALPEDTPADVLIDKLQAAKDKNVRWAYVMYNRPLLDYGFFGALSARADKAPTEEATALRELRTELLEMTEQIDKEALAVQQAKARFLQEALANPDPMQVLQQRPEEVDSLFLSVLAAALRGAQQKGDTATMQKLQAINEGIVKLMQEAMPPELQMVNELLAAEYPQGTEKILREHKAELNAEFMEILETLARDLQTQQRGDAAQRLREIQAQAKSIAAMPDLAK